MKVAFGIVRLVVLLLVGLAIVGFWFPLIGPLRRQQLQRWWARRMLAACGVRLEVEGHVLHGHVLLLANHISWLDIFVIDAVAPTRFVAKSEIRGWPLFGLLAARTGTLFIERGRRHAVHAANVQVATVLRAGARVGIFPEGTTGDGTQVLPFHANLVQAALDAAAQVQPVALAYRLPDGTACQAAAFLGEQTLAQSVLVVLRARPLVAQVAFLPPVETAGRTRHDVARVARADIALSLGVGVAGNPPETPPGPPAAPQ